MNIFTSKISDARYSDTAQNRNNQLDTIQNALVCSILLTMDFLEEHSLSTVQEHPKSSDDMNHPRRMSVKELTRRQGPHA